MIDMSHVRHLALALHISRPASPVHLPAHSPAAEEETRPTTTRARTSRVMLACVSQSGVALNIPLRACGKVEHLPHSQLPLRAPYTCFVLRCSQTFIVFYGTCCSKLDGSCLFLAGLRRQCNGMFLYKVSVAIMFVKLIIFSHLVDCEVLFLV